MKILKLIALLSILSFSSTVFATHWKATCYGGKNIEFQMYERWGTGFLYMTVTNDQGNHEKYQIARLKKTFSNGNAVCGKILGNTIRFRDDVVEICTNQYRNIIYLKWNDPINHGRVTSGTFCQANVELSRE